MYKLTSLTLLNMLAPDILAKYNTCISTALDTHASLKSRLVPSAHTSPWFTPALCILKVAGCHLERLYRKTCLSVHFTAYIDHIELYKSAINTAHSTAMNTILSTQNIVFHSQ